MIVEALTYSICSWNSFAALFNAAQQGKTRAVQSTTDFGKIVECLGKKDYSIFHLTVGVEGNRKLLNALYDLQIFKIIVVPSDDEEKVFAIINASFQTWRDACINLCHTKSYKQLVVFLNKVFLLMEHAAPDCVMDLHKTPMGDCFSLKQRF